MNLSTNISMSMSMRKHEYEQVIEGTFDILRRRRVSFGVDGEYAQFLSVLLTNVTNLRRFR